MRECARVYGIIFFLVSAKTGAYGNEYLDIDLE